MRKVVAKININNIENVEGKYHLMFLESRETIESAKNDMRYSVFALLLFIVAVMLFIMVAGFNLFYVGFLLVFLIFFSIMAIYTTVVKNKAKKQCLYAVQNSKPEEVISTQVDSRKNRRHYVNTMPRTIHKKGSRISNFIDNLKIRRRDVHITEIIHHNNGGKKRR